MDMPAKASRPSEGRGVRRSDIRGEQPRRGIPSSTVGHIDPCASERETVIFDRCAAAAFPRRALRDNTTAMRIRLWAFPGSFSRRRGHVLSWPWLRHRGTRLIERRRNRLVEADHLPLRGTYGSDGKSWPFRASMLSRHDKGRPTVDALPAEKRRLHGSRRHRRRLRRTVLAMPRQDAGNFGPAPLSP